MVLFYSNFEDSAKMTARLAASILGVPLKCAQCHDHKYDPYTIKDHYAMAAFFADIGDRGFTGNSLPTKRPPEIRIFSTQSCSTTQT